MTVFDKSKSGMHRAAVAADARYAVERDEAPLTFKKPRAKVDPPKATGIKCRCGATSSQFTTRRAFNEHREVCES